MVSDKETPNRYIALTIALLVVSSLVVAQSECFEYMVISLSPVRNDNLVSREQGRSVKKQFAKLLLPREDSAQPLQVCVDSLLNEYGKNGWELIDVTDEVSQRGAPDSINVFYFSRRCIPK